MSTLLYKRVTLYTLHVSVYRTDPAEDCTQVCLGLLVNLCKDNFAVQTHLKNLVSRQSVQRFQLQNHTSMMSIHKHTWRLIKESISISQDCSTACTSNSLLTEATILLQSAHFSLLILSVWSQKVFFILLNTHTFYVTNFNGIHTYYLNWYTEHAL